MAASITYAHIMIICQYSGALPERTIHKLACDPEVGENITQTHIHKQTSFMKFKEFIYAPKGHI